MDAGSILVLLGPSGVGKSTVLRLLSGLDDPDQGRIEIGDRVVADPRSRVPAHQRGVGMVFQSLELWPHMTVAENVAFGLRAGRGVGRRATTRAWPPSPRPWASPARCSTGAPARCRAASASASPSPGRSRPSPGVLLYDEPLAHLDPARRAEIRRLVRAVGRASSTTVVYVTHDPAEALEVGDRVAVLGQGRVLEAGTPSEVYAHPTTLAGARALGAVSALPARRREGGDYETALGAFRARGPLAAPEALLLLRPEQVRLGLGTEGAPAEVTDTFAVPGGYAFTVRLTSGETVEGRSTGAPEPGLDRPRRGGRPARARGAGPGARAGSGPMTSTVVRVLRRARPLVGASSGRCSWSGAARTIRRLPARGLRRRRPSRRPRPVRPSRPASPPRSRGRRRPRPRGPPRSAPRANPAGAGRPVFESAEACGKCHTAIYEEWKASWHGLAMVDPHFLRLSDGLQQEECIRCHAPVPLREMENWETPIARSERREDAVSCLSCHQSGANVAGPLGLTGPCRPVKDEAQRDVTKVCFACHNQHKTGEEWLAGPYAPDAPSPRAVEAKTCLDCHMPWVERPLVAGGPVRRGRRHVWPGGHDLSQVQRAGKLEVETTTQGDGTRGPHVVHERGRGAQRPDGRAPPLARRLREGVGRPGARGARPARPRPDEAGPHADRAVPAPVPQLEPARHAGAAARRGSRGSGSGRATSTSPASRRAGARSGSSTA